ncbi:MAG: LytTR family DNA-binding domain-containing protein [Bacteroidia bacterium]|nr:LytTR family DNA-binding domain-containing protein [Bacteroidia bacterium]
MNILIIEDEQLTAEDLRDIILDISPDTNSIRILNSVEESVSFLKENKQIDLIFSDIQLGDGLSFEIFKQVKFHAPIIFCTAYDEYALKAFETNGIHYILKPFDERKIAESLQKFKELKLSFNTKEDNFAKVIETLKIRQDNSLLVYKQDRAIPIRFKDVALFYIKNEITYLITFEQKTFHIDKPLDEIQQLSGKSFFRANRQYIINRNAIKEVGQTLSRKSIVFLNIPFEDEISVSKEKRIELLNWITGIDT